MPRRPASVTVPVTFRFRPPRAAHIVDLKGEFPHFYDFTPMPPVGQGFREATVALETGIYRYKYFLSGDEWFLDPNNPRTRGRDGHRNSIAVVGGVDEPVLHAAARPWVFVDEDGALTFRAGLRRGAGDSLAVRWDEGSGARTAPMVVVAHEDEHVLFEARVPASARRVRYVFELADGRIVGLAGGVGTWLEVELSAVTPSAPEWWRDAVVYSIFVDRFRRPGGLWPDPPQSERERAGGDLAGLIEGLDYIADLGVTALHLTPLHLSPSAHRYEAIDPRTIDPALGGEAAFSRFIDEAHARGLRIICDLTVTHVHRDFFAFRDVRARGFRSPFVRWFYVTSHPFGEGPDSGYRHYQRGQWQEPLLRTDEPEVVDYLAGTFAHYARLGVDGFRMDAAADLPLATVARIAAAAREVRSDVVLFGEVVPENFNLFTRRALDAATDFSHRGALLDWLVRGSIDSFAFAARRAQRRFDRGGPGHTAIGFTSNHDHPRFLTEAGSAGLARVAELLTLFGAMVPAIYYGDEVGLTGGAEAAHRNFEDAWPDRARMPWPKEGREVADEWELATLDAVKGALRLRRELPVLRRGDETFLVPEAADGGDRGKLLVVRRTHGEDVVDVCVNASPDERTVVLPGGAPTQARSLFASGLCEVADGAVKLGPFTVAVLRRTLDTDDVALWHEVRGSGAMLARAAFRAGSTEAAPLPLRLYVTVTERCNLRCEHCITGAPEKTASGKARSLDRWLVEALREPFAAAHYVGFVHGGESLVSPMFPEVLKAIQDAKRAPSSPKADVHLLSNGMLLTPDRVDMIVDRGVTSLSVSLDGATQVTNDSLRLGGRFPTIVRNLEHVIRLRATRGLDLRVGISTVVTSGNVHELAALGKLARDIGVDWLKVEELFPCTIRARHEMLWPRDPRMVAAMHELRGGLAESKIVLVDHLESPGGCGCVAAIDPKTRAFREADDFANRTVFQPCRMEWEQACVDPDGVVHPVAYERDPVGSIATASFLDVWNGEAMKAVRAEALLRTRASMRRACER